MDKIITALDYAKRDGHKTVREYLEKICEKRGLRIDTPIHGEPKGEVEAEINWGRWIARCPDCPGAEDVAPEEPIFYCFSCGNYMNEGHPRKVIFPSEKIRKQIEAEVMKRPVEFAGGANEIDRAINAKPTASDDKGVLSRCWIPGESVEALKRENKGLERGKN